MLYDEQADVLIQCKNFIMTNVGKSEIMVFNAPGGTGKTTVIHELVKVLRLTGISGSVCAFTGRAASQLRKGGLEATTFHSLMYEPVLDRDGDLLGFELLDEDGLRDAVGDYLIVDESSMVNYETVEAMKSIGIPIIFVGDSKQLPPVEPKKEYKHFNPMESFGDVPTVTLKTNRRVVDGKEGLLEINQHFREESGWPILLGNGVEYEHRRNLTTQYFKDHEYDIILCGYNNTRKDFNEKVRRAKGFCEHTPEVGEQVVCLKNGVVNDVVISNGDIFYVEGVFLGEEDGTYMLRNIDTGARVNVKVWNETWMIEDYPEGKRPRRGKGITHQIFTYAYAITIHKSQGSTFGNVLFVDEYVDKFFCQQKFRYTAVSRAANKLTIAK